MKRFLLIMICAFLFTGVAFSETSDLSSLSFEELQSLKKAVDGEYFSRQESEGIMLQKGQHVVGEGIKAGQYYVACVEPNDSNIGAFLYLYDDMATYEQEEPYYAKLARSKDFYIFSDDVNSVVLQEGNVIIIQDGPLFFKTTPYECSDYYTYEAPAGTLVSKGTYVVGVDIPADNYLAYPGTIKGGEFNTYVKKVNEDGTTKLVTKSGYSSFTSVYVKKTMDGVLMELEDGDIVEVKGSIIMARKPKLQFD